MHQNSFGRHILWRMLFSSVSTLKLNPGIKTLYLSLFLANCVDNVGTALVTYIHNILSVSLQNFLFSKNKIGKNYFS